MTGRGIGLRRTWTVRVALLMIAALAAGCGRPPDEAWLRFLGFKQGATTISVLEDNLREENTLTVDVEFENGSLFVGQKTGTGILVNRARIDYRMAGFSPPSTDYPLNLYLAAPAESTATKGTLTSFPLAPASLKEWLINTGAFDDAASDPIVELTARVTFFGVTDDGTVLETEGSIRIALTNTGATSTGTATTVYIKWLRNVYQTATGTTGAFTVYRTGNFAAGLDIVFATSGTTIAGTDYTISTPVVIPALSNNVEIRITPVLTPVVGDTGTVTLTLSDTASYTAVSPKTDTLTIFP